MKTIQYRGPFQVGETLNINLRSTYKILQIGMERPLSIPITVYQNYYNYVKEQNEGIEPTNVGLQALLEIEYRNSQNILIKNSFVINENDILEFNGLYQSEIKIRFLSTVDKYTIIDLAFKDVDE